VLVVGLDTKQIPLSYTDNQNTITGFEVDMATEAAKRAGMTVEFVPVNWAQKDKALSQGKVNSLWGELTITPQAQQNTLFTKPYMYNSVIFIVSSDSTITSKIDLVGLTVGTIGGSQAAADLQKDSMSAKFSGGAPQIYNDNNTLFTALQSGQIDAVAVDETMGEYYINQNTLDYKILPDKLSNVQYAVGVRRNDSRLRNSIQSALDAMAKDGTSKTISMKWFGKDYSLQ
jgi:polar amino acid transport system substrate-binding protein